MTILIPTPTPSLWAGMGHCSGWAQERVSLPQFSRLGFPQSWPYGEGTHSLAFLKAPQNMSETVSLVMANPPKVPASLAGGHGLTPSWAVSMALPS